MSNHSYLADLASQAHSEGAWGYAPGQAPHLEPTCFAVLALAQQREKFQSELEKAMAWVESCAVGNGIYRLQTGRAEAVWPTALVLFTKATLGEDLEKLEPLAKVLLSIYGRAQSVKQADEVHDIDLNLKGWPWGEGNFSWVEPTCWSCMALRRIGQGSHPRVEEGQKLLLDRAFDEGGINYGNRHILGKPLDPEPGPTALMLVALQDMASEPRVIASIQYLQKALQDDIDLEHLCLSRLALMAYRDQEGVEATLADLAQRIENAHQARPEVPWLSPSCYRQALTALALGGPESNPFLFKEESRAEPLTVEERKPEKRSLGERFQGFMQKMTVTAIGALRQLPQQTAVHIATTSGYQADLADVVRRQYESFREAVPLNGKRVVLKPNLVEYHRDKVINTHPNVIAAVIELCQKEGAAEVLIAEGPGHWRNLEYLVRESGLGDVLKDHKVKLIDLNHDEPVKRPNLGRLTGLEHLYLTQTIDSADVVISLPKLKTHHWAVATLSLKNLFGTMPGICYGWPKNELHWRGIDNSIVDIALTRTPDLAIVDGIVGMEGDGPLNGTPKEMGVIIMGTDLVAVDATCCRLMELNPEKIGYLVMGSRKKLGLLKKDQIQQIGEQIEELAQPFETLDHFRPVWMGKRA